MLISEARINKLKSELRSISARMEEGGDAPTEAFCDLKEIIGDFELLNMSKKMKDEQKMFAVFCFLRDYMRNLESNFGPESPGFPCADGFGIFYNILKDIGRFIEGFMVSSEKDETTETLVRLYVNYASLLDVTNEAVERESDQEFIKI